MIKLFIVLVLMTYSFLTFSYSVMPENDLWKEDHIWKSDSNLDEAMFNKIIDLGKEIYDPVAESYNETLTINKKWDNPTVNANMSRWWNVTINMYGGLARRPEINPEAFALVLCHELGHAYGGNPYLRPWSKISAEGQADYYGAKECLNKITSKLNLEGYTFDLTDYMLDTCEGRDSCVRGLSAGQSLGHLLSVIKEQPIPNYETPDETIVDKTKLSYPNTVQCRLDTYHNGVLNKTRPRCWYKPE